MRWPPVQTGMVIDDMHTMMYRSLLPIALLFLCGATTVAQIPVHEITSRELQVCLVGTGPAYWDEVRLTPDQKHRVMRVQEACKEECNIVGAQKPEDSISNADGSTIMAEVKAILSEEQYRTWVANCAAKSPAREK